ncbi:hypothetical protein [Haliangium sp.]|uniref:hypothetical protein n=1 Tax=Haliangium sp. TaxID=2663208 RepID=UPI003D0CAD62
MLRNTLLALTALTSFTLAGCEIYIGPEDPPPPPPDCGPWGCDEPPPPPGTPGGDCRADVDCMAGCFCNGDNWCEESGFCDGTVQCNDGWVCDGRATCVPEDRDPNLPDACEADADCPFGFFCEEVSGQCLGSWTCREDAECGPGWDCDERGTCVPTPCEDDADCAEGCYCDVDSGQCIETGFCEGDDDCALMGYDGYVCDGRGTCVPPTSEPDPGECIGEVFCDLDTPLCEEGFTPGIANGCYTGACIAIEDCPEPPPPACEELPDEAACFDRADCAPTYVGLNCSDPNGASCTDGAANCSCQSYSYDGCTSN